MERRVARKRSERFTVAASVIGVLLLTVIAAGTLRSAERATDQARLDGATASLASVLRTELARLSDAGTDVGVALSLIPEPDPQRYRELMEALAVGERFPGVFGIARVAWVDRDDLDRFVAEQRRIDPEFEVASDGGDPTLRVVTNHHPLPQNAAALGIDLSGRGETRVAADRAVATGRAVLSDATVIEQLGTLEPGAVIHAPVPQPPDAPPVTVAVVLSGQRFVEGLDRLPPEVGIEVVDPTSSTFSRLAEVGDHDPDADLTSMTEVRVASKTWQLATSAGTGFTLPWYQRASSALALGGLLAAALVGLFVRSLATRERVASDLAQLRTRELSAANDRLARSNAALAASSHTKDAFLAAVSHELRTPLTVIAGFVDTLRRIPADDATDRLTFIEPIERNVRRLDSLVSDLLTVTSLDADAVTAFRTSVDLRRVLPETPQVLAGLEGTVTTSIDGDCVVEVDPRHLDRILVNLLVNAERHGAPPIELRASAVDPHRVEIRVRDHGPGIPADEREHLFERFARGDDRGNVPGTGLGLAIVRELAELNGGQVTYEAADPGACFVLRLQRSR